MRFTRTADGSVWLEQMEEWVLQLLSELPELASQNLPEAARKRLYPDPSDDPELQADWGRHVVPELLALLASAADLVASDLAQAELRRGLYRVPITRANRHAWISILNAALQILGATHGIVAADIERTEIDEWSEREEAIGTMHILYWLQALLIEDVDPEAMEGEEPEGGEPGGDGPAA